MSPMNLNTSYKYHTFVGLVIGIWLALFLVLIAPFDAADLSLSIRLRILPFYGLIAFVTYIALIPVQNWLFRKMKQWTIVLELFYLALYNLIALVGCYAYYKTDIINGTYDVWKFTFGVYYPIFFILFAVLVLARWYSNKRAPLPVADTVVLKGDNKLDILQISFSDLVSISSADNYIEVNYLKSKHLQKKLLRTTLKRIQTDVPELLKVHRSHLINPAHFKEWKDANTLNLTQMQVPVSKKYKSAVLALKHSSLKMDDSPLS
ncbi:LytTR family DNA-binding domain-containing protein [Aggregatimonas sangjinii]|nr:LytTR family DNA-binding domain-containing protein [Aggregatimonas sangjinii]